MKVYNKLQIDNKSRFEHFKYWLLAKRYTHQELCRRLDEVVQSCEDDTGVKAIFVQNTGEVHYKCFDQHDFESRVMMDFANLRLAAPVNYQHCLYVMEGPDYMRLPSVDKRTFNYKVYYDCDVSYQVYQKRLQQMPENIGNGAWEEIRKYFEGLKNEGIGN